MPPAYPLPAETMLTVPRLLLITTKDLVEKLDASEDPNTVLPLNPPIFRAPLTVLPKEIDLSTSK